MKPTISKEFIFEYFRGKATSIQKKLIDEWARDPKNEETFYQYLEEWERLHPQYMVDVNKGIQNFKSSLKKAPGEYPRLTEAKRTARRTFSKTWIRVAAVIIVTLGIGWVFKERLLYISYHTNPGEVAIYNLPDGSRVTLNANSDLRISRLWQFNNEREVFLLGEAEFNVAKNEAAKKFTVKTNNQVDIVVQGTIFTVFNRHRRTEVVLNEGKVKLIHQVGNATKTIEMVPGDKVLVEPNQQMVVESGKDFSKATLWKHKRFEFDQTSLETISEILKDYYGLEAVFNDPGIQTLTLTGSFVAINEDEFLESICLMNGLRYQKTSGIVNFYKENQ